MTQQPYYGNPAVDPYAPQGAQQYPPPPYQPAPNGYAPAPNPYAQPPAQYNANGYGTPQGYQAAGGYAPQQPPAQPVGAKGTLDQFHKQPHTGGGKGISFKNKPDMYTYVLVVKRTPEDGDLFQDSDPQTKQLKFWRDGSPKMVLGVQCRIVAQDHWQAQEYADGDASFYLRSGLRDEVTRAMSEVGKSGVPERGALVIITLTHRKPGNNIATNMYAVQYHPAGTWEHLPAFATAAVALDQMNGAQPQMQPPAPAQAYGAPQGPYQGQAPYGTQAPAGAPYGGQPAQATPNPQQYAQSQTPAYQPAPAPQYGGQAYDPNQAAQSYGGQPAGPNPQQAYQEASGPAGAHPQYAAPNQAPVQGQLPGMPPQPPVPPQGGPQAGVVQSQLTADRQALLAQLQGQQGQAPNPQQ